MATSTPTSVASGVDASALSRRELQFLARELELCRGNAKSDVIVEHLLAFMASGNGATRVAALLEKTFGENKTRTPAPKAATTRSATREEVTPQALSYGEDATPTRRSTRNASRNAASDNMSETASAPPSRSSSPPPGRRMDFDMDENPAVAPSSAETDSKGSVVVEAQHKEEIKETSRTKSTPAKNESLHATTESTPAKESAPAKESTPVKKESTPAKKESTPAKVLTPAKKESTPAKKESTPAKKVSTPAKKESTPAKKESTPAKTAVAANEGSNSELAVSTKTPPRRQTPTKTGRSPLANVSNVATKKSSNSAPSTVEELLDSISDLVSVGSDRVKCTTTGHEMKADFDVISSYISGKRYQRAHKQTVSFAKYAPIFVDHPDEKQSHLVWCSVTQSAIARNVERIEAHINGARYQKELPLWQAEQAALAAEKEATQKRQDEQKDAHRTPTKKTAGAKRKKGPIPEPEERRVKVPRTEAM